MRWFQEQKGKVMKDYIDKLRGSADIRVIRVPLNYEINTHFRIGTWGQRIFLERVREGGRHRRLL